MNRIETFPVHIRCYADPEIRTLMIEQGGIAALGRWVALLGIIYDFNGCIPLSATNRAILRDTLQIDDGGLDGFLASCAERDFIDAVKLSEGKIISSGVQKQIEYIGKKRESGSRGGKARGGDDNGRPR